MDITLPGVLIGVFALAIGLGLISVDNLNGGIFGVFNYADLGWLGIIAAIALAFAGAIYQTRTISDMSTAITSESYMNPGLNDGGSNA